MARVAYTVSATHPTPDSLARYLAWLSDGHVAAVIRGGAESATLVRMEGESELRAEARYVFPSREVFDRYVRDIAPALRADGAARFGPGSGVVFVRSVGEILELGAGAGS